MKGLLLSVLLVLALAGNLVAADTAPQGKPVKNLCLLDSNKCSGNFRYDLQEKIKKLTEAIDLGSAVYSPEEVKHLEHLLEEADQIMDDLNL